MKRIVFTIALLAAGLGIGIAGGRLAYNMGYAQTIANGPAFGDAGVPVAAIDAGPAAAATSDIATAEPPAPAAAPVEPDGSTQPATPVAVDASFWSRVEALWRSGSLSNALLLAALGLLILARRWVPLFQRGNLAMYSAIGVTGLTTLAEPLSRGTTPSLAMIITALTAAGLVSYKPAPKGETASGELPVARIVKP